MEMNAIGAGAVNQAIKAVAIARGFLAPAGIEVAIVPSFKEQELDGKLTTAMALEVVRI